jgi:mRNA-degrading endonuclease YafQ of YafQ-DinJ toxin-antitoxin module
MANIIFALRDKQKDEKNKVETPIYLIYRIGNEKLVYPTGFKVNPDYWQEKNQRVNPNKTECVNKDIINNFLNELRTAVDKFIATAKAERRAVSKQVLKRFIDEHLHPKEQPENTLSGFMDAYIKRADNKTNPNTGKPIATGTKQIYKRCRDLIKEYEKKQRITLDFESVNMDFYEDFTNMLKDKNLATNTIGKVIATLKIFLNEATDRKINTNTTYKSRKFKVTTEISESIYLNDSDLKKLVKLDLTKKPTHDRTRDLFLIGCYTGLRYSDFSNIRPEQITEHENGLQLIEIKQQKTGEKVIIHATPQY